MSRIGNLPVEIPQKVEVSVDGKNTLTVKGPKGTLTQKVNSSIKVEIADGQVKFTRSSEDIKVKAMHGLYRALCNNMIHGVSKGFTIEQRRPDRHARDRRRGSLRRAVSRAVRRRT